MILKNSKFRRNKVTMITRICDECGKTEEARLGSVKRGREIRGKNIDLCGKCAYLAKYAIRKITRGEGHHSWKHGLQNGYKRITLEGGRRVREHIYIYEQYLGRRLKKEELIHHIDFDKLNNDIYNLVLFKNNGEHTKCHMDSMRNCALLFLNSKIWFNFKNNKYTLKYDKNFCQREKIEIEDFSYKKSKRADGIFYTYEDPNGKKKYKKCHILISERMIGRRLYYGEVIHHIDGNHFNNDPNNLVVLNRSNHNKTHHSLQYCTAELYKMGLVGFNREKKEYYLIEK